MKLYLTLFFALSSLGTSFAQSLPVGMPVLEDAYRREQLQGNVDSLISFMVRPLFTGTSEGERGIALDTVGSEDSFTTFGTKVSFDNSRGVIQILPLSWLQQYNSKIPYGWNDGSVIPAKGYQTQLSFGAYARYGPLSLQLKPELVFAKNSKFEGLPTDHHDVIWAQYYDKYFNVSDIPERYGEKTYSKALWGQSSLRLSFDPVSVGISGENLYWGPGVRGSLLMSNNAPGFKHITLSTTRPVITPIGSFEAQMVVGRLENSGLPPPEPNRVYQGKSLYIPKQDDWRYLSGFVLTYSPRGVPGLFIGASRVSQVYHQDAGKKAGDFFPLLQPFEKKNKSEKRDYLSSLFFRWVWKEGKAEVYGEYGHNASRKLKEFLMEPDASAAYLIGFRKLIPFSKIRDEYIQTGIELIELQQTSMPEKGGWYTSSMIRQGYTHRGQVLGAGIGPGSNLQSLDISWIRGLKRIGFQLERYVHNNDLYYQIFTDSYDFRKHWIDMSYSLSGDWDYKNLVVSARASMIRNMNYHYVLFNRPPDYFVPGLDFMNYQVKLGVNYRF